LQRFIWNQRHAEGVKQASVLKGSKLLKKSGWAADPINASSIPFGGQAKLGLFWCFKLYQPKTQIWKQKIQDFLLFFFSLNGIIFTFQFRFFEYRFVSFRLSFSQIFFVCRFLKYFSFRLVSEKIPLIQVCFVSFFNPCFWGTKKVLFSLVDLVFRSFFHGFDLSPKIPSSWIVWTVWTVFTWNILFLCSDYFFHDLELNGRNNSCSVVNIKFSCGYTTHFFLPLQFLYKNPINLHQGITLWAKYKDCRGTVLGLRP
jgi:hypothetical protein